MTKNRKKAKKIQENVPPASAQHPEQENVSISSGPVNNSMSDGESERFHEVASGVNKNKENIIASSETLSKNTDELNKKPGPPESNTEDLSQLKNTCRALKAELNATKKKYEDEKQQKEKLYEENQEIKSKLSSLEKELQDFKKQLQRFEKKSANHQKSSEVQDQMECEPTKTTAVTEAALSMGRRRLRPVKSAESLANSLSRKSAAMRDTDLPLQAPTAGVPEDLLRAGGHSRSVSHNSCFDQLAETPARTRAHASSFKLALMGVAVCALLLPILASGECRNTHLMKYQKEISRNLCAVPEKTENYQQQNTYSILDAEFMIWQDIDINNLICTKMFINYKKENIIRLQCQIIHTCSKKPEEGEEHTGNTLVNQNKQITFYKPRNDSDVTIERLEMTNSLYIIVISILSVGMLIGGAVLLYKRNKNGRTEVQAPSDVLNYEPHNLRSRSQNQPSTSRIVGVEKESDESDEETEDDSEEESVEEIKVHFPRKKNSLKCDICRKDFKSLYYLKRHKLTHENESKHKCTICNVTFKQASSMLKHMKNFHLTVQPKKN